MPECYLVKELKDLKARVSALEKLIPDEGGK